MYMFNRANFMDWPNSIFDLNQKKFISMKN